MDVSPFFCYSLLIYCRPTDVVGLGAFSVVFILYLYPTHNYCERYVGVVVSMDFIVVTETCWKTFLIGAEVRTWKRRSVEDVADSSTSERLHAVQCQASYHRHCKRLLQSAAASIPACQGRSHRVRSRCTTPVRRSERFSGSIQSDHDLGIRVCSVYVFAVNLNK